MKNAFFKGFAVAALHLALVGSLAAKYALDRQRLPRVWVKTVPYDPTLPVRGRYIRLQLQVENANAGPVEFGPSQPVRLVVTPDGKLSSLPNPGGDPNLTLRTAADRSGTPQTLLSQPVAFFIPEHMVDPSSRPAGEELWVEVTVPKQGPPRPVQLGVKKADGVLEPLVIP